MVNKHIITFNNFPLNFTINLINAIYHEYMKKLNHVTIFLEQLLITHLYILKIFNILKKKHKREKEKKSIKHIYSTKPTTQKLKLKFTNHKL